MMEALGKWLLSVSAAALLVSVVQTLIPEGGMRRVASFTGGLLLLAVLLRPVLGADFSGLSAGLDRWTEQVEQRQWELESAQTDALAAGIAERAATYISDKGAALGLTVTAAVETRAGDDGIPPGPGGDGGGGDGEQRGRRARPHRRGDRGVLVGGAFGVHRGGTGHPAGAADVEGTGQ